MKKALSLGALIVFSLWLAGCASSRSLDGFHGGGGGGGGTTTGTLQSGNWAFTTSGGINGTLYLGGYLTNSGTSVTGHLFVIGDQGSGFLVSKSMTSMLVTGTLSNGTLTLSGALSSSNITLTFTGLNTSGTINSLTGNYSVTGGTDNGDSGVITGQIAGSLTGTWQGTDTTSGGTMTVSMTEASGVQTDSSQGPLGSFALTATSGSGVTFVGPVGCTVTGTLVPRYSFAAGGFVLLDITTIDNGVAGEVLFAGATNNTANPTAITNGSFYVYTGGSSCLFQNTGNPVGFSLTKQ